MWGSRLLGGGVFDQRPALANNVAAGKVDVILAGGPLAVQVAKSATSTIPAVFYSGDDPVEAGLVKSLDCVRGRGLDGIAHRRGCSSSTGAGKGDRTEIRFVAQIMLGNGDGVRVKSGERGLDGAAFVMSFHLALLIALKA